MKYATLIFILFYLLTACGQTTENKIEPILLKCLIQSYEEQHIDITSELNKLENYLIETQFLKSSSGQSYYDFYKQIEQFNDTPAVIDYDRFEGIYKLTPDQFYSIDCLEQLQQLNPTTLENSKYIQLTIATQKASQDEISLSKIAKTITSVLSPSDFNHPYYRAIALLTIAYTANVDSGISTQLTPNDSENYDAFENLLFSITGRDQIILNGKEIGQEELKSTLSIFIETHKSNHLIKIQTDGGVSYDFYLTIQETIKSVYNDLRDELAKEKFNKPYDELNESDKKEIREIYPFRVKE